MAKNSNRGPKFVLTRIMLVAGIGALVVGLWGTIAASAAREESTTSEVATEPAVLEQDGWRWDEEKQDWVLIEEPTAVPAAQPTPVPQQIVIIERQPEIRYIYYRYEAPTPVPAAPVGTAAQPAGGGAVSPPAATPGPQAAAPSVSPGDSSTPSSAPAPTAQAAPADSPAPAAPEPPAPAPVAPTPISLPPTPVPPPPTPIPPPPAPAPAPPPPPKPAAPATKGS